MTEIPAATPEKREIVGDNARKFIIGTIDPTFLEQRQATSYDMNTHWIKTGDEEEEKVVVKIYPDKIQRLLIAKVTKDGDRSADKQDIDEGRYTEHLASAGPHSEKRRYEFIYEQADGKKFSVKYDEFVDSQLRIIEIDAPTDDERAAFNPEEFPAELIEVTGQLQYYGYRIAETVKRF